MSVWCWFRGCWFLLLSAGTPGHCVKPQPHSGPPPFGPTLYLGLGVHFGVFLQRRFSMPRRGWQALDIPSGWYEVIRGPRPRSVQWPLANLQLRQSRPQATPWEWGGPSRTTRGPPQQSPAPRLDPDERCAAAQTKVQRLEAALAAFGEEDSPEKDVLKDFLARVVEQAKVKRVDVRIKFCESYLQRCTKQLKKAKASVKNFEEEVATPSKVGQIEDGSRFAIPRDQSAPRGRRIGSDSPPEASVRVAAEVPSHHIRFRDPRRRTRI